jgi:ferredoxin-NADP reductase
VTEPLAPAGGWRTVTVACVAHPSARGVVIRLNVPDRVDHWPGQHYVVRLTAEDGYTAQRSYSIASPPSDPLVELYVERLEDGEVSGFLADILEVGDTLEVRGPIGGWFVWTADRPALGVAGGSGVVPMVAMLRHAIAVGRPELLRLAVSARRLADLPYAEELLAAGAFVALTRELDRNGRSPARLTSAEIASLLTYDATCFICGSASFAGGASDLLIGLGVAERRVKIEQFGPS